MNCMKDKKKFLLLLLTSLLSTKIFGCDYTSVEDDADKIENVNLEDITSDEFLKKYEEMELLDITPNANISNDVPIMDILREEDSVYDIVLDETTENSEESYEEEFIPNYEITKIPSITAIDDVNIRDEATIYAPIMGLLKEGDSIKMVGHSDGWYEVKYYNRVAYVSDDYAKDSVIYDITGEVLKTCYTTESIEVSFTNELNGKGKNSLLAIPKYESVEIYEETETEYLVKTSEYVGYIEKQSIDKYLMDELKPNYEIVAVPSVTATSKVNIRKNAENGEVIGSLIEGTSLKMLNKLDNGWYEVEYYDCTGYISGDYVYESSNYDITGDILKICYATEEVELIIPASLNSNGIDEKVSIPELECFEIYEETDNNYLVKTHDYIGFVQKQNLEQLSGTLITVDISSQEITMYENNEVILRTPVVTGNPNKGNATHQGLFEIYRIAEKTYLKGPGYSSYVDVMMYFYKGEGLHDASWRTQAVMGGNTYITNGSHGCVNMLHDDAFEVLEHSEIGTRVLVKE